MKSRRQRRVSSGATSLKSPVGISSAGRRRECTHLWIQTTIVAHPAMKRRADQILEGKSREKEVAGIFSRRGEKAEAREERAWKGGAESSPEESSSQEGISEVN